MESDTSWHTIHELLADCAQRYGGRDAIVPSVEGWAQITGLNTLFIDDRDPFAHGFQVV